LARLEEWKKMQREKNAKKQAGTPTTVMSPTVSVPTPSGASTPTTGITQEAVKATLSTQKEPGKKISIKLSDSKKANPLQGKSKAGLLGDEDNDETANNGPKPRGLIRLEPAPSDPVEDSVASPEEQPPADEMDLDDDPLDAFMNGLDTGASNGVAAPQGIIFDDDMEPEQTAVEGEDLLAMAASRKKRKEVAPPDHSKIDYLPFQSNLYIEPQELSNLTPEEVRDLRLELDGIQVKPDDGTVPRPVLKWAQMGLLSATMDVFHQLGYTHPTPIQSQAIPAILSGRNIIGIGKTGSGQ
jgi:ATP-dependent RNA helicase DDX46/PRP5